MQVRRATEADLQMILECHIAAFPKALSSRLGSRVVRKMLQWYLGHSHRFLLWLGNGHQCLGYVGGSISDGTQVHGSASSMIQHSFYETVIALLLRPWLWFHPELLSRYRLILKNVYFKIARYNRPLMNRKHAMPIEPYVGLVVIGVQPRQHGKGYGSMLLRAFEETSFEMGHRRMLLTVLSANSQAIRAYERNGWTILTRESTAVKMEKTISQ